MEHMNKSPEACLMVKSIEVITYIIGGLACGGCSLLDVHGEIDSTNVLTSTSSLTYHHG